MHEVKQFVPLLAAVHATDSGVKLRKVWPGRLGCVMRCQFQRCDKSEKGKGALRQERRMITRTHKLRIFGTGAQLVPERKSILEL